MAKKRGGAIQWWVQEADSTLGMLVSAMRRRQRLHVCSDKLPGESVNGGKYGEGGRGHWGL